MRYTLKDYQDDAVGEVLSRLARAREDWEKWKSPVAFSLTATTGAGKTVMAAAVIEERRALLWTRDNVPEIGQLLRAISHRPDDLFRSAVPYLRLPLTLEFFATNSRVHALNDEIPGRIGKLIPVSRCVALA